MEEQILRISELNQFIKDVINAGFPQTLWICGEIQGYDRNKTRSHVFFELAEKEENSDQIKARIGAVIWAGKKAYLADILSRAENAFELKDGIEVKLACRVDFYPPHGAIRLIVEEIDPTYTLGKLAQEKQKLIALLKKKGVLDQNKKLEFPLVPLRLGLITAEDSAAYNDFLSELQKSGFAFQIFLKTALMQGKNAQTDIARALKFLNTQDVDVIVLTRGGGSLADLSCFDSQLIAEAIASSRIPVLTGIGHEINLSIADLAAHTFAKTPTAIAQFLVGSVQSFVDQLNDGLDVVLRGSQQIVGRARQKLKESAGKIQRQTLFYLKDHQTHVARLKERITRSPFVLCATQSKVVNIFIKDLSKNVLRRIEQDQVRLSNFEKVIRLVRPEKTLRRGFTITRDAQGHVIKDIEDLKSGDFLVTQFADGQAESQVQTVKEAAEHETEL